MNQLTDSIATTVAAMMHALVGAVGRAAPSRDPLAGERPARSDDRGAVSIETVLWYAAAAVSVAVVAAIIWSQIRTTASTGVDAPSAP